MLLGGAAPPQHGGRAAGQGMRLLLAWASVHLML